MSASLQGKHFDHATMTDELAPPAPTAAADATSAAANSAAIADDADADAEDADAISAEEYEEWLRMHLEKLEASKRPAQSDRLKRRHIADDLEKAGDGELSGESAYLARQLALDDLCKACRDGDMEAAVGVLDGGSYMIRMNLEINAASATTGDTPLVCAVDGGELEIVKLLVERGASVSKSGQDGMTPLHCACGFNRVKMVKYLLARGASASRTDDDGQTPADLACAFGHKDVLAQLKLAATTDGLDALKIEMFPEEHEKKHAAELAKFEAQQATVRFAEKEKARERRERREHEEVRQHFQKLTERRRSLSMKVSPDMLAKASPTKGSPATTATLVVLGPAETSLSQETGSAVIARTSTPLMTRHRRRSRTSAAAGATYLPLVT